MGEPVWSTLRCKVPAKWVTENGEMDVAYAGARVVAYVVNDDFYNDDVYVDDVEGEPDAVTVAVQGQVNYGYGPHRDSFGWLVEAGVPFEWHAEASPDWDGEAGHFDKNGGVLSATTTNMGCTVVDFDWLRGLLAEAADVHVVRSAIADRYGLDPVTLTDAWNLDNINITHLYEMEKEEG